MSDQRAAFGFLVDLIINACLDRQPRTELIGCGQRNTLHSAAIALVTGEGQVPQMMLVVILVILARKLARVAFALMKNQDEYISKTA